jgi:hypothetical protein
MPLPIESDTPTRCIGWRYNLSRAPAREAGVSVVAVPESLRGHKGRRIVRCRDRRR